MSLKITLQSNKSANEQAVKTIKKVASCSGELKNETDIINPTILISGITASQLASSNYFTISDFKRKYFLTSAKAIRNNLWEISGHCDVLSSFWSELKSQKGIIARNSKDYNLYLNDEYFRVYQNPHIVTKTFSYGFKGSSFVILLAGGKII